MVKVHTNVTIDHELRDEAKKRGINISKLIDESLREALSMDLRELEKAEMSENMKKALEMMTDDEKRKCIECIKKNRAFAKGWKNRIKNTTGFDVAEAEIIDVFQNIV